MSLDEDQLKDIGAFYSENENSYDSGLTVDEQSYNSFRGFQGNIGIKRFKCYAISIIQIFERNFL